MPVWGSNPSPAKASFSKNMKAKASVRREKGKITPKTTVKPKVAKTKAISKGKASSKGKK